MAIQFVITKAKPKTIYRNFSGDFRPVKLSVKNIGTAPVTLHDSAQNNLVTLAPNEALIFTYDGKQATIEASVSVDHDHGLIEVV